MKSNLIVRCLSICAVALTSGSQVVAQSKPAADLIVTHAKVWTVDRSQPKAEAIAVLGERIVAVGSSAEVDAWRGPNTRIIDAGGKLVVPGFNDAHVHFVDGGRQLDAVQLNDATTPEEFKRRIAERVKITPKGEWVEGGDWDETKWPLSQMPTRQLIDDVTGDTPVFLSRYDGHVAFVNSVALRLAGVTAATPDPPGGTMLRDAQGNPTGSTQRCGDECGVEGDPAADSRATHEGCQARACPRGITRCNQLPIHGQRRCSGHICRLRGLQRIAGARRVATARGYFAPSVVSWDDQAKIGVRRAFGSSWLRIGALKGFADGSLGATTAYFFDPYNDSPGNRGLLSDQMQPPSAMRDRMLKADAAGLQLCTHAIGDQGISMILDFYADIVKQHGPADRRFRIEHAQHMAAKDFDRFAQLGVIASVQPYHAIDDGRWAEKRIGRDRASRTYAFRTFLDHGVHLAFGTDWEVAPLNPMFGLYAAVTRATLDDKNPQGWFPEQKLTVAEAVEAYTMGSAYAEFQDKEKGSITAGKLADIVVLSDDIFSIDPVKIRDVGVLRTIVGGKQVYAAEGLQ